MQTLVINSHSKSLSACRGLPQLLWMSREFNFNGAGAAIISFAVSSVCILCVTSCFLVGAGLVTFFLVCPSAHGERSTVCGVGNGVEAHSCPVDPTPYYRRVTVTHVLGYPADLTLL